MPVMDIGEVGSSSGSWKMVPNRNEDRGRRSKNGNTSVMNLADPELELVDPNPDVHQLFVLFNDSLFYGALGACTVEWSKRMTSYVPYPHRASLIFLPFSCAGVCQYYPNSGLVTVRLSEPLLKLRPRSDLIDTLLARWHYSSIISITSTVNTNNSCNYLARNDPRLHFRHLFHPRPRWARTRVPVSHEQNKQADKHEDHHLPQLSSGGCQLQEACLAV